MADPDRNVPSYHEPGLNFENNPDEFFDINFENSYDHHIGENAVFEEDMNQSGRGTSQAGPSVGTPQAGPSGGVNDQSNEHMRGNVNPENSTCGNPIPLLQWPNPPEPFICSNCQVLREIIHTIEGEIRKFEIHGRVGLISHGVLEICHGDMTAPYKEHQIFEFCNESIPDIKTFLTQYCEERSDAGYTLVKDPLLAFSEVLSLGSDWEYGWDIDEIMGESSRPRGDEDTGQQPEATDQPNVSQPQAQSNMRRSKRKRYNTRETRPRTYKNQRDFIKELKVKGLVDYFNLTIDEAAKKIGICESSLKAVLKKENFKWPGHEIIKLEGKIEKLSKDLTAASARKRARAEAEIEKLKQEKESYYAPFR